MIRKKLTRKAKTAKAKRDLRYANSRSREIKRADSQKKRRAAKKAGKNIKGKDYDQSFKIFKERVLEMSASIKDAISIDTFLDVKHLGGAAAAVIADDEWFKGKRHANQAFQVYDLWKNQNQSPSFLSFRNKSNKEQFIILSGPHRPRYLKSN